MNTVRIRPSTMHRAAACPGSAQLEAWALEHLPQQDSAAASMGSACHAAVAAELGGPPYDEARHGKLDPWSLHCVRRCVEFARALPVREGSMRVEVHLPSAAGEDEGIADVLGILKDGRTVIVDWKFGFADNGAAADHMQLMVYAVAAAGDPGTVGAVAYLVQPRLEQERQVTAAVYDPMALERAYCYLRGVVEAASDPHAKLQPGQHCGFCAVATRCPQLRRHIMDAQDALTYIGDPQDAEGLGKLLRDARMAADWGEAVQREAKLAMAAGQEYDGFRLQGSGTMTEVDAAQALALAGDAPDRIRDLLAAATFRAGQLKACPWVQPALNTKPKSPSIRAEKK
jgi:hypothetical protein